MKKILSETLIYGIGAILPRVIVVILNYLFIKNITHKEFATFSNLYAGISFVNVFLSFGFETAYFRFSSDKEKEKLTFSTSFVFLLALSGFFLLGIIIFLTPIACFLGYSQNPEYIFWFAFIAFFDTLCVIPLASLRFHNKPIQYTLIRVATALSQSVIVIAMFLYIPQVVLENVNLKEKVSYPFISNLLASFIGFLLVLPILRQFKFIISIKLLIKMLRYSWPIMIAGMAFMINENFDKFIQKYLIPDHDAGAYGGCYKMAALMTLFVTAYRMGVEPFFFKQMNRENAKHTYAKVTEYFSFFSSAMALGIIANISWLKNILVPNSTYWIALDIIPIIVIANLFFGIYYNLSTWYKVTDKTHFGTLISFIGAIITILGNYFLLKKYGFMVSAWTTLISYLCMMGISYFLGQKNYPIPYRKRKILFFISLMCLLSFVISYYTRYDFWIGNLIFILYSGIIIVNERGFILSKINYKR